MKITQKNNSRLRSVFIVMMCLIIATLGSTSVFAAVSDIPEKGWDRLIGDDETDQLNGVISTADGGIVSVGCSVDNSSSSQNNATGDNDGIIVKSDSRGTIIWSKFIGGSGNDVLTAVTELDNGSILVAGYSTSSLDGNVEDRNQGKKDGLIAKYSSNGTKIWDMLIGGSDNDVFNDIIPTSDGGFLAVGTSSSTASGLITDTNNGNGTDDGYIVKFDSYGSIVWDRLFGSNQTDQFYSVTQTSDGGIVVAGSAICSEQSENTLSGGDITDIESVPTVLPHDGLLVKFNLISGATVWNNLFGSSSYDDFFGIAGTTDGGFVVAGRTAGFGGDVTTGEVSGQTSALIAKFNSAGTAQWNRAFTEGGYPALRDIAQAQDGSYLAVGEIFGGTNNFGWEDGLVTKISSTGNIIDSSNCGGDGYDYLTSIALDQNGLMIVAGNSTSSQSGVILDKNNGGQDGLLSYFGESLYTVTFKANGGTSIQDQVVSYGDKIESVTNPEKSGYTFVGWYSDSELTERFPINAPIVRDATLYAKWYVHIGLNKIESNDRSISGVGQPDLSVTVSLPDGSKLETLVKDNGKWTVELPKAYTLRTGDIVKAVMYDIYSDGIEVSNDEEMVTASISPPDTGDFGGLLPIYLFGIFLGLMIMVGVATGPKTKGNSK